MDLLLGDKESRLKDINKFIQHPLIHSLITYDMQYKNREIQFIERNYSSDASSLWGGPPSTSP